MSKFLSLPTGLALTAGLVLASTATAQTSATFVKDINTNPSTTTSPSYPSPARGFISQNSNQWVMMGGKFYFQARTDTLGAELYVSDGTAAGTKLVADINKGSAGSYPYELTVVGSKIFFRATTAATGYELWVTDGTKTGTKLVADIRSGSSSSYPSNLARVGTKVVFSANDGVKGTELWISDGTKTGTTLLKDINPGTSSSYISYARSNFVGNKVFFRANDGKNGYEPWVTDGTAAGTKLVKDIRSGSSSSYPAYFQVLGALKVVFEANDGTSGTELWVSDGTAAGTKLVKDVYAGSSSGTSLYSATPFGGTKVLFRGRTAASGYEAWVTDGTTAGTIQVADIRSGATSSYMYYSAQDGGKAYWGASSAAGKYEIWVTDGTKLGTKRFGAQDMTTGSPSYIAATNGMVFFQGRDVTAGTGYEISMCTAKTSQTVKDIRSGTSSGYAYYCYPIAKGVVAFAADDGKNGRELWISKGTAATTTMIDINKPSGPPPTQNDNVSYIESFFGKVLFSATDGSDKTKGQHGQELWISDGSAAGTKLLKDIYVGTSTSFASNSYPSYLARLGNYVYFRATDGTNGYELWRTDGTTAGTKLFKNIRSGSSSSSPSYMTRIGNKIYFQANDGTNGIELWVTDGTTTGTKMVANLYAGAGSSYPRYFCRLGHTNQFVFYAYTSATGYELFISDGTSAGTKLLKDIQSGSSSSYPSYMRRLGDKVYFQARTTTAGYELWVTDGTAAGTKMVKDLLPGTGSGYAQYIEAQNKKVYFYGYSTTAGYEMHMSDGTSAGTKLYWNLNAGTASTYPRYMTAVGSRRVYFQGQYSTTTTSFGTEPIWFDVTTNTGTIYNVNPGGSSYPYNWQGSTGRFAVDNGYVYMAARPTNVYDNRLLKMQNGATAQAIGRVSDSSVLTATDPRIGKNMSVVGATGVKNPLSVLCLGITDSTPNSLGSFVPGSYAYFQLTNYFWVVGNYPGKAYGSVFGVPNDPTLLGDTAVLQAFSLNSLAFPAMTEVTNGIHLTMGK